MTYDLRRRRLHGLIERIPSSHRYRVTELGFRSALFLVRSYVRLLRPGLAVLGSREPPLPSPLRKAVTLRQGSPAERRAMVKRFAPKKAP